MPKNLMSVEQYANARNMARQTVYKHIRQGKIKEAVSVIGGKKKINPSVADQELSENLDQVYNPVKKSKPSQPEMEQTAKTAGTQGMSMAAAQRLQAQYKAALLKLDYEQKSKKLVNKADYEAEHFARVRQVRDALLNIPDRVSAELASYTDVHVVNTKLTETLIEILEELSA